MNKGIARVFKFLQPNNYESDRSHFLPIPKGHSLPHSGLTTAYDRTNHSQFARPYRERMIMVRFNQMHPLVSHHILYHGSR
ncbi:hypothetical protein QUA00_17645 [Microcoleus sp. T2B6]|uniref:hypothetical protein n=1 Tax=Microcoleus sp. T2B6 TaxID=3055424 RepID=UPI002FD44F00